MALPYLRGHTDLCQEAWFLPPATAGYYGEVNWSVNYYILLKRTLNSNTIWRIFIEFFMCLMASKPKDEDTDQQGETGGEKTLPKKSPAQEASEEEDDEDDDDSDEDEDDDDDDEDEDEDEESEESESESQDTKLAEDQRQNELDAILIKQLPKEPRTGKAGTPEQVITNHFKLTVDPSKNLFRYHVTFKPEIDNRYVRTAMLNEHEELLGKTKIFDGNVLYIPRKLRKDKTEVFSTRASDKAKIAIVFVLDGRVPLLSPVSAKTYTLVFKKLLKLLGMTKIRQEFFTPSQSVRLLTHKLELWPGFRASVQMCESDLLLCVDLTHKLVRTVTVLDAIKDCQKAYGEEYRRSADNMLAREHAMTRYNGRIYRIEKVNWETNPQGTFSKDDWSKVSFVDYFLNTHKVKITDMTQPLLICRPDGKDPEPIVLPPELCYLTGISEMDKSDFQVTKDIETHTKPGPFQTTLKIKACIDKLNKNRNVLREMAGWGLQISSEFQELKARVLPPETIQLAEAKLTYKPEEADWSKQMRNKKLKSCVALENWLLVFTAKYLQLCKTFVNNFKKMALGLGMEVQDPRMIKLPDDIEGTKTYEYMKSLSRDTDCQVAVCVFPEDGRKERYATLKKFLIEKSVLSQFIKAETLSKRQIQLSVVTRISMQINCKLGGESWTLDIPKTDVMVIGIDCCPGSTEKDQSAGAVVASVNDTITRFHSRCIFYNTTQEFVEKMAQDLIPEALRKYHAFHETFPKGVVVYRDGVALSKLFELLKYEVPQLLESLQSVSSDYNPEVTFVVVNQRGRGTVFRKEPQLANLIPGTVVDTQVNTQERYDFYLQSSAVIQGVSRPTYYNVVYDTSTMSPDDIQKLTYKLCHLYYNQQHTISVPSPCQYAQKLAELVGKTLDKEPSVELADTLYYL